MWLVVGLVIGLCVGYFLLMFLYPEWVGISGEDTRRTLDAHQDETTSQAKTAEQDLLEDSSKNNSTPKS